VSARVLVVDNYDSFVFNLVQYLYQLGAECEVRHCADTAVPVFGVCLGMQSMAVAYGGVVDRAPELLHGKTSPVTHDGTGVFAGLPSPFIATRYHSLAAEPVPFPAELEVTARTADGIIMGLRHRELPVEGVQFHPESVLTEHGHRMLANWLEQCGDAGAVGRSAGLAPVVGKALA
jgi:para-aminobenzoate synthetase component 2